MTMPSFSPRFDRRGFLAHTVAVVGTPGIAVTALRGNASAAEAQPPATAHLQMSAEGYPRAFFWWTTCRQVFENAASTADADRVLSQLQGLASPSIYLDYFSGFKSRHAEKLVFLFSQGYVFSEKPTVYDPIDRSNSHFIHKFGGHDRKKFLSAPWRHHRLVMAAAQLVDAAFTSFYTPQPGPGETAGLWDEMVQDRARETGWLGQPLGPAVYLARLAPDLLEGKGARWPGELVRRFQGSNATFVVEEGATEKPRPEAPCGQLRIGSKDGARSLDFALADVPCKQGQDLLISVKLKAQPRAAYPAAIPRHLKVETDAIGQPTLTSFVNDRSFEASFYFRSLPSDRVTLRFTCEGGEPLWLSELKVHAHADAAYRLFENGLVLANPSDRPFTFDLKSIQPARRYRWIGGSPSQDPVTNDGAPVGKSLTLAGRDGLFLAVEGDKS